MASATTTTSTVDLAFCHALADLADGMSLAHHRSEGVRMRTKDDGTPVSWFGHAHGDHRPRA